MVSVLFSHNASLHPGVQISGTSLFKINAGVNPAID